VFWSLYHTADDMRRQTWEEVVYDRARGKGLLAERADLMEESAQKFISAAEIAFVKKFKDLDYIRNPASRAFDQMIMAGITDPARRERTLNEAQAIADKYSKINGIPVFEEQLNIAEATKKLTLMLGAEKRD